MTQHHDRDPATITRTLLSGFLRIARDEGSQRALTRRLDDALVSEIPEFAAIRTDLDASTHDLLAELFRNLEVDPSGQLEIPAAALGLARTVALRGHDIGVLLRAYRIGQRLAWTELSAILATEVPDPGLRIDVLTALFDKMSLEVERVVDESIAVFSAERDRWLSGALARKADTIRAILSGQTVDPDEATQDLGHRLHRHQLALLLWLEDSTPERGALSQLDAAAQEAAALLNAPAPLTIPDGVRSLRAWLTVSADPDLSRLDRFGPRAATGVRVATGLPEYGVAGFRASHRQAQAAARVAESMSRPRPVTRYEDVAVVAPFLADPEATRELVARELGPLATADEPTARLRETLLAWLRAAGSARDAAAAIGVHKNTVLYRLRGIEQAVGHPLDKRRLQIEIALEIVDVLGDTALPGAE